MLELLVLWQLGKSVAAKARARGKPATRYVCLLLALWFLGEVVGAVAFTAASAVMRGRGVDDGDFLLAYLVAITGASVGAYTAFKIVGRRPPPVANDAIDSECYTFDNTRP
jgi:hypothetical protein